MPTRTLVVALIMALGCAHDASSVGPAAPAAGPNAPAAQVGAQAPDAQLVRASGTQVALADVLHQRAQTVVVFYRGFW